MKIRRKRFLSLLHASLPLRGYLRNWKDLEQKQKKNDWSNGHFVFTLRQEREIFYRYCPLFVTKSTINLFETPSWSKAKFPCQFFSDFFCLSSLDLSVYLSVCLWQSRSINEVTTFETVFINNERRDNVILEQQALTHCPNCVHWNCLYICSFRIFWLSMKEAMKASKRVVSWF